MTEKEKFWNENQSFFLSSFRQGEKVVYIEELHDNRLWGSLGTVCIYAILACILLVAPPVIALVICFATVYITIFLFLRISAGACRRSFFVLTTHSVYFCKGFRGIVVFEWPCSSLKCIIGENGIVTLLSSENPGDVGRAISGGIGRNEHKLFFKNIVSRLFKKPLINKIYDASNLGQVKVVDGIGYAMIELHLKKRSVLYEKLEQMRDYYPQVEFRQVKLKPIKEVWPF